MIRYYLLQFAQRLNANEVGVPTPTDDNVFNTALNIVYFLAGVVAVIVIVIAGITYATSGGDSSKITKAKNQILFAVVGIILVLSAFAITNFVVGRF